MRTNYPLDKIVRRKNEGRRRFIFSVIIIFIVFLLLALSSTLRVGLNKLVVTVTRPFWVVENNTLVLGGDLFNFLRSHKGLVEENRNLKEDIFKLKTDLAAKKVIAEDYERLSKIIGRTGEENIPIIARVVSKPNHTPYDLVLVDVGSGNTRKVKVGDIARLDSNITIGRVSAVSGKIATIELFSSPGLETSVLIGPESIMATTTGRGGGNMILELPRGFIINKGDSLVLPSGDVQLVGLVGEVINDQVDPAQKILASLPVNIFNLSWIEIYDK